jgi:uncharacterized membrane protein YecN with MAPEG domain
MRRAKDSTIVTLMEGRCDQFVLEYIPENLSEMLFVEMRGAGTQVLF